MSQRRIRIDLTYDGTDFSGWQWQERRRTVQGVVEASLTRLAGDSPVRLRAAGRTDAGVHARQQVADCRIATRLDDAGLAHALAKMLPPDVRPSRLRTVPDDFHSMHDAQSKTYLYRLDRTRYGDPLRARYALHHPHVFDVANVRRGLPLLVGRRDWSGFADSRCRVENRVRDLCEARYEEDDTKGGVFTFSASGFLTYMVRNMVGTLLAIASGHLPVGVIERMLDSGDRRLGGPTAPARGLCLVRIVYPDELERGSSAPVG